MSQDGGSIATAMARLLGEGHDSTSHDVVRCDRCGAVRFVPALVGLTHAHCPRVVQGTWRAVPGAQN